MTKTKPSRAHWASSDGEKEKPQSTDDDNDDGHDDDGEMSSQDWETIMSPLDEGAAVAFKVHIFINPPSDANNWRRNIWKQNRWVQHMCLHEDGLSDPEGEEDHDG